MAASLKGIWNRFTPSQSASPSADGLTHVSKPTDLFPTTDPAVDGEECLHDCDTCTVKYPAKFSIDEDDKLFGHIKGWSTHLLVATGKTDWVRDVADEKGSIMEAVEKSKVKPKNGKLMLSASDMPLPHSTEYPASTSVLVLPSFTIVGNVVPANTPELIEKYINHGPTNTTPLSASTKPSSSSPTENPTTEPSPAEPDHENHHHHHHHHHRSTSTSTPTPSPTPPLTSHPSPHAYLILLCSQKTRDARCGQSAPLLRREFERHLRPLGLYRDLHDERPGGVGIYFISHVGGHKYSANVMVYRRAGTPGTEAASAEESGDGAERDQGGAAQCIWLARVRPEDCENIVRYTVLKGKVVKPERQLRGGFDRARGLVSW